MRTHRIVQWLPAVLMMVVIFIASSTPSTKIPNFGTIDVVVKKAGHMLGYASLALAYWYGLGFRRDRWWLALLLAILYAFTDEFHQIFTFGRHPSLVDVIGFDGGGASIALLITSLILNKK